MAIDFEAIINKQTEADGTISAANAAKLAATISSAVGKDFVPRERYNAKLEEIETLKNDKQTAEDTATNAGKWKEKYEKLKGEYEGYKADVDAKAKLSEVKAAYKKLLEDSDIDARRIDTIIRATSFDGMKLDKEGKLEGSQELKKAIDKEWSDFKVSTSTKGAAVENPPHGSAKLTKEDIYKRDDHGRYVMSTAERQKALAEMIQNGQ